MESTVLLFSLAIVSLGASLLTFYSGFGLGTLLLPTFLLIMPASSAIFLTAAIHFINNITKLILVGKLAHRELLIRFGVPSLIAAILGAYCLDFLQPEKPLFLYSIKRQVFAVSPLSFILGIIILFFGVWELLPHLRTFNIPKKLLPIGGFLSGFFGGLSGHQGALRSAFLIKTDISKEVFIGTSVVIACGVDLARIGVYLKSSNFDLHLLNTSLFWVAAVAATLGSVIGKKFLKVTPLNWIRSLTGGALMAFGVALALGWFGQ